MGQFLLTVALQEGQIGSMRQTLPALTGARAVAALLVVFYHLHITGLVAFPTVLLPLVGQGRTAVAFFFMLSGFVLAYRYAEARLEESQQRWRFYRARLARVLPLYVLAHLLATPLIVLFWINQPGAWFEIDRTALLGSWLAALGSLQVFVFGLEYVHLWNAPGWSVSAELFFYLLFPALFVPLRRLSSRQVCLVVLGMWLIALLIGLGVLLLGSSRGLDARVLELRTYFWPPARIWEFAIGVGLGVLWKRGFWARWQVSWGVGALILLALLPWAVPSNSFILYLFYPPVMAVLLISLAHTPRWAAPLASGWGQWLGAASYAIYIFHWLPFIPLNAWGVLGTPASQPLIWGLMIATLGFALLMHVVVERPARRWLLELGRKECHKHNA